MTSLCHCPFGLPQVLAVFFPRALSAFRIPFHVQASQAVTAVDTWRAYTPPMSREPLLALAHELPFAEAQCDRNATQRHLWVICCALTLCSYLWHQESQGSSSGRPSAVSQ